MKYIIFVGKAYMVFLSLQTSLTVFVHTLYTYIHLICGVITENR